MGPLSVKLAVREQWVYLEEEDVLEKKTGRKLGTRYAVREWPVGQALPEAGSLFRIVPPPYDLLVEAGLHRAASDVAGQARVLAQMGRLAVAGWRGIDGEWAGPASFDLLPSQVRDALAIYVWNLETEARRGNHDSGRSLTPGSASRRATRARRTATNATS